MDIQSCVSSEPHAAGFRSASEIRTKATPCVEVWQIFNLQRLRLGEEKTEEEEERTRMWTNAQPDDRPAEHRWRPLFNAAKFG